jgi:hypothetical protein
VQEEIKKELVEEWLLVMVKLLPVEKMAKIQDQVVELDLVLKVDKTRDIEDFLKEGLQM